MQCSCDGLRVITYVERGNYEMGVSPSILEVFGETNIKKLTPPFGICVQGVDSRLINA